MGAPVFTSFEEINGESRMREHDALKRTDAERAAGVTPVNYAYKVGNVLRYGARCNGVDDDSPAFQAAIDVSRVSGCGVYVPNPPAPDRFYLLLNGLNITTSGSQNRFGVHMYGDSGSLDVPCIVVRLTAGQESVHHALDLTGSIACHFSYLNIRGDSAGTQLTCFFLARNSTGDSAQQHRFDHVQVRGAWGIAPYYNYCSEDDQHTGCAFINDSNEPGTKVCVWTGYNRFNLESAFVDVYTGVNSCIDHKIFGGEYFNRSGDAAADVFYIEASNSVKILGPWPFCGEDGPTRSLVFCDLEFAPSNYITIFAFTGETGGANQQNYGITFSEPPAPMVCEGWHITAAVLPANVFAINVPEGVTLSQCTFGDIYEYVSAGINIEGDLENSHLHTGKTLIVISGTSKENHLVGDTSRWNIPTRDNDNWTETGSANRVWTADTSGITVTTAIVENDGEFEFHDRRASINLRLVANTTLAATAGQTIGGLLANASKDGGNFNIYDASTLQYIGSASIAAGSSALILPLITARAGIVISGTYFVA